MATAKRLYLYGVSLAGLAIAVAGLVILLQVLLNNMHVGTQYWNAKTTYFKGVDLDRSLFTYGLGMLVAGLITWLFHWSIVERMVRAQTDEATAERRSIVRSLYFAAVMAGSLWIAVATWVQLVAHSLADRLQGPAVATASTGELDPGVFLKMASQGDPNANMVLTILSKIGTDSWLLAIAVVATAVFGYHLWIRDRDLRTTELISGAAAWVARFYLYGAALIGLFGLLDQISALVDVFAVQWAGVHAVNGFDALNFGRPGAVGGGKVPTGADWVRPAIYAVITGAAWAAVWFGHWWYSLRLRASGTPQGEAERVSKVRLAFLVVIVAWGVNIVVDHVSFGLGQVVASFTDYKNPEPTWYLVTILPIMSLPWAAAWWWHRKLALGEEATGPAGISADRILLYVTALVGLAALAGGAGDVIRTALTQIFSKAASDAWKLDLSLGLGAAVVGAVVWYFFWRLAEARLLANRATDTTSYSRTYYLYAILGLSVLAAVQGLSVLIWRYSQAITGPKQNDLARGVAPAFASVLVFGALIVYHSWIYRRDTRTPEGAALALPTTGPATIVAAPKGRGGAKAAAAAKPAAKSSAKPAAKPAAKAAAKPAAKRTTTPKPKP